MLTVGEVVAKRRHLALFANIIDVESAELEGHELGEVARAHGGEASDQSGGRVLRAARDRLLAAGQTSGHHSEGRSGQHVLSGDERKILLVLNGGVHETVSDQTQTAQQPSDSTMREITATTLSDFRSMLIHRVRCFAGCIARGSPSTDPIAMASR